MLKDVIAVFDIGKNNKKFLLFDTELYIANEEETKYKRKSLFRKLIMQQH